jgi:hypothetical protein
VSAEGLCGKTVRFGEYMKLLYVPLAGLPYASPKAIMVRDILADDSSVPCGLKSPVVINYR